MIGPQISVRSWQIRTSAADLLTIIRVRSAFWPRFVRILAISPSLGTTLTVHSFPIRLESYVKYSVPSEH